MLNKILSESEYVSVSSLTDEYCKKHSRALYIMNTKIQYSPFCTNDVFMMIQLTIGTGYNDSGMYRKT